MSFGLGLERLGALSSGPIKRLRAGSSEQWRPRAVALRVEPCHRKRPLLYSGFACVHNRWVSWHHVTRGSVDHLSARSGAIDWQRLAPAACLVLITLVVYAPTID